MTHSIALTFEDGVTRFVESRPGETVADAAYRLPVRIVTQHAWHNLFAQNMFIRPALKDRMDPRKHNGGVFLGLNGVVVKSHGGATAAGFGAAIRIAVDLGRSDYMTKVGASLQRLTAVLEHPSAPPAAEMETSQ